MPSQDYKRESYSGYGNSLTQAFEFALVPAIFGAMGYLVDRIFGIVPIATIVMVVVALVGLFARMKYRYDDQMRQVQVGAPWSPATGVDDGR